MVTLNLKSLSGVSPAGLPHSTTDSLRLGGILFSQNHKHVYP